MAKKVTAVVKLQLPAAKATPPKVTKSNPEYYQPDEMDEILEALEHVPIRWKAITYLLIDTGCRRGEVMGLKWEKLNLEKLVLTKVHAFFHSYIIVVIITIRS